MFNKIVNIVCIKEKKMHLLLTGSKKNIYIQGVKYIYDYY